MASGKQIKHYRDKAGWKLADLSMASGVDVGTISALEIRDSKRSQFFAPIARAFGLTVEQLADDTIDHEILVVDRDSASADPQKIRLINRGVTTESHDVREPLPHFTVTPVHDELTLAAIKIMQGLDKQQKFAMLAKMREFKQHLDPPRVGQAL